VEQQISVPKSANTGLWAQANSTETPTVPPRPPPSGPGLYIFGAPDLMRGGCRLDVPLRNNSGDLGWANRPNGTHWQ
jgi:hypothetical protein